VLELEIASLMSDIYSLIPSAKLDFLKSIIGKKVKGLSRFLDKEESFFSKEYGISNENLFSLGSGLLRIRFEDGVSVIINRHSKIQSLILWEEKCQDERLSEKFLLEVDDSVYGDKVLSELVGEEVLGIKIFKLKKEEFLYDKFPFEVGLLFQFEKFGLLPSFKICSKEFSDFIVAKDVDFLESFIDCADMISV
jgi:hypothetical protein